MTDKVKRSKGKVIDKVRRKGRWLEGQEERKISRMSFKNLVFADNICEKRTNTRMEERRVEPGMEPVLFTLFICESVAS